MELRSFRLRNDFDSPVNKGLIIAAIVVGSVMVIAAVVYLIWRFRSRVHQKRKRELWELSGREVIKSDVGYENHMAQWVDAQGYVERRASTLKQTPRKDATPSKQDTDDIVTIRPIYEREGNGKNWYASIQSPMALSPAIEVQPYHQMHQQQQQIQPIHQVPMKPAMAFSPVPKLSPYFTRKMEASLLSSPRLDTATTDHYRNEIVDLQQRKHTIATITTTTSVQKILPKPNTSEASTTADALTDVFAGPLNLMMPLLHMEKPARKDGVETASTFGNGSIEPRSNLSKISANLDTSYDTFYPQIYKSQEEDSGQKNIELNLDFEDVRKKSKDSKDKALALAMKVRRTMEAEISKSHIYNLDSVLEEGEVEPQSMHGDKKMLHETDHGTDHSSNEYLSEVNPVDDTPFTTIAEEPAVTVELGPEGFMYPRIIPEEVLRRRAAREQYRRERQMLKEQRRLEKEAESGIVSKLTSVFAEKKNLMLV